MRKAKRYIKRKRDVEQPNEDVHDNGVEDDDDKDKNIEMGTLSETMVD